MESKKILIVDDDYAILTCIQAMLEDEGYTVKITDRAENIENFQHSDCPNLIILDVLLSGKDGREIARELKSHEKTRHIPLLMTSAHPRAEETVRAAGADDFLAKPFDLDELLAKVAKYT